MQITIGTREEILGTLTLGPEGITMAGDTDRLAQALAGVREPGMSDDAYLRSLPQRLNSYYCWAVSDTPPLLPPPPTPMIRPWEIEDWDEEMEQAANEARAQVAHMKEDTAE